MKKAEKCGIVRAIDACATIMERHVDPARCGQARERRRIGKLAAHANADVNTDTDAHATTGDGVGTRLEAAERLGKAAATTGPPHDERTAPAALPAPIHRPALLIQPYSLFCILLVGELPTDFPDRAVGES
ncbi:hypothetical protein [Burkholderia lata]|uniref:hypothetical protein n=1 Tax=Burkholderia lata (strain ATCC 17760 / DSM 23089 / LMG 22485 / NCIMB 9086 / R18194 / 383) TaxID=482957 RepID=UPI00158354AC|nr:hypothetical protein [Burkholderia lata]